MYYNNLYTLWNFMPTYLVFEIFIFIFSIMIFTHSIINKLSTLWLYGLICGILNDYFFMLLSLSNTFWHSQSLIMLSDRMPLYIPFMYTILIYPGFVIINNTNSNTLSKCIISSFIGALLYSIYDYIGAKFIWWTWHTTDYSVKYRWLGVPYSSTCWTIIHIFSFLLLFQKLNYPILSIFLTIPTMMILMGLFSIPFNYIGAPDENTLVTIISIFVFTLLKFNTYKNILRQVYKGFYSNYSISSAIIIYSLFLLGIYFVGDSKKHFSYGLHQQYGPDNIKSYDLFGYIRNDYFSKNDTNRLFILPIEPELYSNEYMIQGT